MIAEKTKKSFLPTLLVGLFLIVTLVLKKTGPSDEIINGGIAVCGLLCFLYYTFSKNHIFLNQAFAYGALMLTFLLASLIYNSNASIVNILWIWAYLGVALLLYEKDISPKIMLLIFVLYVVSFLYDAFQHGLEVEDLIVSAGSVNNISTMCILSMCIYYLSKYKRNHQVAIEYWPIIPVALISILTATRGAILALTVFFGYAALYNSQSMKNKRKYLFGLTFLGVLLAYFFANYYDVFGFALTEKTDRVGMESARTLIWNDYITGTFDNMMNLVFGVPGTDPNYRYLSFYSGNPHNAFFMLHSKFGLGGFLLFVIMTFRAIIKAIRKKEYFICGIVLVVTIRSIFDWTAFPGLYDIFFWYFLFYAIDSTKDSITKWRN